MKNKSSDVNNILIAQLEKLSDESLSGEDLQNEIKKSSAMASLSTAIANNHKNELTAIRLAMENGLVVKENFNNLLNLNQNNQK